MTDDAAPVVITGIGMITAAGATREQTWERLLAGTSAIGPITAWDTSLYATGLAGAITDFDPTRHFGARRARQLDRCHQLALVAAREAVVDARLAEDEPASERVAVIIGSSLGGTLAAQEYERILLRERRAVGRYLAKYPLHVCLDLLTREFGYRGARMVVSTACTASTIAIAYAMELLRAGRADVVLTGGVDPLTEFSFAGFSSMNNVSATPCAPFSQPIGLTVGEAASMLILERADRARRRQASVYAELLGYGLTCDAHHLTSPDPASQTQVAAARMALQMAGVETGSIGYVNAHGTGTTGNDEIESRSLRILLREQARDVPISSVKGALGHTLGAAGGVELALTALAVNRGVLPPTANFTTPRPGCDLDYIPLAAREKQAPYALSLNFAFGGNNAALVVGQPGSAPAIRPSTRCRVVITGMGMVTPLACSVGELRDALQTGRSGITRVGRFDTSGLGSTLAAVIEEFAPARFTRAPVRRMDRIGCFTICAAELALRDSELRVTPTNQERVGLIVGTMQGPATSCERFFSSVAQGVGHRANPALFPNTVLNAGSGLAAIHLRIKGCNIALSSGQASGLNALCMAYDLIRTGVADLILAGGVDELDRGIMEGYAAGGRLSPHQGRAGAEELCSPFDQRHSGLVLGEGGVVLALESFESAQARGAKIWGELLGFGGNADLPVTRGWDPSGESLAHCMATALDDAGVAVSAIDFVGAGAMSHPIHDRTEARAIRRVFGERRVPVGALASRFGVSAVTAPATLCATLLGMAEGFLPGGVGYERGDAACDIDVVHGGVRPGSIDAALVSASSLGGSNYALVVKRWAQ